MIRRGRGDAGQVGGIEVLPFGFLVFISGTLLFANAWGVIDARLAVSSAAREATRAYVEADNAAAGQSQAEFRALQAIAAYGRDISRAKVLPAATPNGFARCARVTITVTYDLPILAIPFIGGFGDLAAVESTFTELIDPFRDGVGGTAAC